MLPVPLLHKPFPMPQPAYPECGKCHIWHPCKTLHLQLDSDGAVIVSPQIWADLQRTANRGGFTVANPVTAPPTQTIRPETKRIKLRGVDLGGVLAQTGPRAETFTATGKRSTTRDAQPATRTVTVDQYVDVANRAGVGTAAALNLLLAKVLAEGPDTNGEG